MSISPEPKTKARTVLPELDDERIQQALAGDSRAFSDLYSTYSIRVRLAVASRLCNIPGIDTVIDDVVSQVWETLVARDLKLLCYYDPKRSPFGFFIRMLAAQSAGTLAEKVSRRLGREILTPYEELLSAAVSEDDLERGVIDRNFLARLSQKVEAELDDDEFILYQRTYLQGMPVREVGKELGGNMSAVYKRHRRLLQKLKRLAEELLAETSGCSAGADDVLLSLFLAYLSLHGTAWISSSS